MSATSVVSDVGGVRLDIDIRGSGPPFVWAHPLLGSMAADDRSGVFDWSGTGARLIRYDARSHGRSSFDPRAENHRWEVLAADMLSVADATAASSAVFGGASMGAATALWAARLAPERVRGLVLAIPPTAWGTRAAQSRMYRGLATAAAVRVLYPATLGLRLPRPRPGRGSRGALVDSVLEEVGHTPPQHLAPPLRGSAESDLPPLEELDGVDVPTLILAWKGDRSHPRSVAEDLADVMPRAELEMAGSDLSGWPDRVSEFLSDVEGPQR